MDNYGPRIIKRRRGVKLPPHTVYVGRPSRWGNPYRVPLLTITPAVAVQKYEREVLPLLQHTGTEWLLLRGKNLACWCYDWEPQHEGDLPPLTCHAAALWRWANKE